MFDTVLLRSFVAVVQEGGFTHAAARLNLTQSAVSAHLRRLEKQTGRELLVRTTRSVTLTADGELLLGYARAGPRAMKWELGLATPRATTQRS